MRGWVSRSRRHASALVGAAVGLAAAGPWLANWLITVTFPELRNVLGGAYGFYAVCAVLSFVFVWRSVQETRGEHLEDMRAETHEPAPH